ncbi:hypothetical protein HYALB_00006863 [Hymenoscyphus albidus]|uniref:Uncharacterized protein n=1 Tax=Hymenoscyphus albidus TaxID=595503 RepID=A0A9N9LJP0_9HELO|nr:hypothetical protein HYALB_00006863 [Hymenoscyphus albidus]
MFGACNFLFNLRLVQSIVNKVCLNRDGNGTILGFVLQINLSTIAAIVATGVLASPAPKAVADGNSLLVPPYNLGARSANIQDRDSLKDKDTVEFCGLENGKRTCNVKVKADKKCYILDDWWKGGKFKTSSFESVTDTGILCEMYRRNDCGGKASSTFNFAEFRADGSDNGKKEDSEKKKDDNEDRDRDDRKMKMKSRKRDGDEKDEDRKDEDRKDEGKKDEDKKDGDKKDGEKGSFDDSIRSLKCSKK